jgi:ESCRT-I complex subunit MVB12
MNQDLPITALCIVSEASKCPPNYTSVTRTHDTSTEIDLWKDGLFGRKINRFICFTKDYPINDVKD